VVASEEGHAMNPFPYPPSLDLTARYEMDRELLVRYGPRNSYGHVLSRWGGTWRLTHGDSSLTRNESRLLEKLATLGRVLASRVTLREAAIETPTGIVVPAYAPRVSGYRLNGTYVQDDNGEVFNPGDRGQVLVFGGEGDQLYTWVNYGELPIFQRRLVKDIVLSIEARCWRTIRARAIESREEPRPVASLRVLISYRSTKQATAEALANRVSDEGIDPWFDKWEVQAGDSIPGKIEEAFRTSKACLLLWSADHSAGAWCTEEMHTAISKRVTEGYKIIPIRLDDVSLPDLLAHLRRVDLLSRDHFEDAVAQILESLLGLELGPAKPA